MISGCLPFVMLSIFQTTMCTKVKDAWSVCGSEVAVLGADQVFINLERAHSFLRGALSVQ
jgi:hypothetical protein